MPFLRRSHGPSSPRPIISAAGGDAVAGLGAVLALATTVAALLAENWLAVLAGIAATAVTTLAYRRSRQAVLTDVELDELRAAEDALSTATNAHEAGRTLATSARNLIGAAASTAIIEGVGAPVRVVSGEPEASTDGDYGPAGRVRLLHHAGVSYGSIGVSAREDGARYTLRHERILDVLAARASATVRQLALVDDVITERQTLADLVASSSEGIFSVDADGVVLSWNPAMAGITGRSPEIATGAPLHQSFAPRTTGGDEWSGPAGADDQLAEPEVLSFDRGDEVRWLWCTSSRLRRGGHVVIARDITEDRKVAADKQGWIAQVSHELRTPLTPIKGFLQTLIRRNDTLTPEERVQILDVMMREEQRLEDLVNSLLRSSRLDEASLALHVAPQDWAAIVVRQVELYRNQDPSRTIECRIAPDLRPALVDPTVGAGVLANLLSNAVKYGDDGPIEVTVEADAGEIVTSVIDHGPGIPQSDRDRVFERFTRLGDHLTRRAQGVGLGLHIARASVARLDGELWIDDTPGGGATFRFTLPMTPIPAGSDQVTPR